MPKITARLRGSGAAAARALPAPRDEAALTLLRAGKALVTGRALPPSSKERRLRRRLRRERAQRTPAQQYGTVPGPPLPKVEPIPADYPWASLPPGVRAGEVVESIYDTGRAVERYDVALLEELNEQYRDRPIVPNPRAWTAEGLGASAPRRLSWAHNYVDLRDKKVLEIGCGNGIEVWMAAHSLGCDAYGIDVIRPITWQDLAGPRVSFTLADMAEHNPYEPDTFDRVISYTCWEHVVHPYRLLEETYKVLKPGGLAWIRANLYAGPQASHRYREIYFPWPHLLFTDEVIREWDEKHGRPPRGSAWVNRLSWNHYERYFHDVGFTLRRVVFQDADWDEEFYQRFSDVLGRIPRTDLRRDFFLAVLEKPLTA